jgi:hypothetical protein
VEVVMIVHEDEKLNQPKENGNKSRKMARVPIAWANKLKGKVMAVTIENALLDYLQLDNYRRPDFRIEGESKRMFFVLENSIIKKIEKLPGTFSEHVRAALINHLGIESK